MFRHRQGAQGADESPLGWGGGFFVQRFTLFDFINFDCDISNKKFNSHRLTALLLPTSPYLLSNLCIHHCNCSKNIANLLSTPNCLTVFPIPTIPYLLFNQCTYHSNCCANIANLLMTERISGLAY